MRQLMAFTRKEFTELVRSGKLWVLLVIFVLFGIMNPAIAKLTPWMMEMFADSLKESGMIMTGVNVDALTSWTQFYKNIPVALIAFLLICSTVLTAEYQKGTLINMLTKGLSRWKVIAAKTFTTMAMWTLCYWMCFGITWAYNAYFWENDIAKHIMWGAFLWYLLGMWLIALMMFMSVLFNSSSGVLVGTGGIFIVCYILTLLPDVSDYVPTTLMTAGNILGGDALPGDYRAAAIIALLSGAVFLAGAVGCFNRKDVG